MSGRAYYNEIDKQTCAWLRELIKEGHIADGDVDERSIQDVRPEDLKDYAQCHFFAGIGGWSLALRIAGWPDDEPVWTGSCPCQPFSVAGTKDAHEDDRHLWPEFFRLIQERQPSKVFGEQVASKDGELWLSGVRSDLEQAGYRVGAANLCAAGITAPQIRQRFYWMADADGSGLGERIGGVSTGETFSATPLPVPDDSSLGGLRMLRGHVLHDAWGTYIGVSVPAFRRVGPDGPIREPAKRLRLGPVTVTMANGIPSRVVRLRGYGNAIVPQVAAEFIKASVGAIQDASKGLA